MYIPLVEREKKNPELIGILCYFYFLYRRLFRGSYNRFYYTKGFNFWVNIMDIILSTIEFEEECARNVLFVRDMGVKLFYAHEL